METHINEIPTENIYKYNPTPGPSHGPILLPKLFVPQHPPKLKKPPPALKLEKPLAGVELAVQHKKYSYSPRPYPVLEQVVKPHVYKGKIVFIDKP